MKPGEVLGVLGRTGSGKTSLTRLIVRFYDVSKGSILLDGLDVRQFQLATLRQRVAMVTQDVQLFEGTIRDNITFFNPTIADQQIIHVLETLELDEWFKVLPDGLDTHLTSGGRNLSAGQAQLLAFVRVFLRNPGLVILDEASSRLDIVTEQRIATAIDKLLNQCTGVIIAHRLQAIQRADQLLILENGRVIEYGSRIELSRDPNSYFYKLLQAGNEAIRE